VKLDPCRVWAAVLILLATSLPLLAQDDALEGKFVRQLPVSGAARVEIETGAGNIIVRAGAGNEIRITGAIHVRPQRFDSDAEAQYVVRKLEAEPPIARKGRRIRIGHLPSRELRENVTLHYELVVPAETDLRTETGLGDQTIVGLRRRVRVESGAGNILIASVTGDVRVRTGLGNVEVRGLRGIVHARTGAGNIRAEGQPSGDWRLDTSVGDVSVHLLSEIPFELHARSGFGGIETRHRLVALRSTGEGELHGRVGGGGVKLELETRLGNIRVE